MPLNNAAADAIGSDIAATLAALDKESDQSEVAWQTAVRKIFAGIVANGKATLPASSVVTTGSAATQTGPAAPVELSIS